jgi:hypothetical protein
MQLHENPDRQLFINLDSSARTMEVFAFRLSGDWIGESIPVKMIQPVFDSSAQKHDTSRQNSGFLPRLGIG